MKMLDWAKKLDSFLEFNGENILTHAGKISHQMAQEHAEKEFEKYELARREIDGTEFVSDFDKMVKHLPAIKKNRKNSI